MGFPDIIKLFTREGRKFYFFLVRTAGYWPRNTDIFRTAFIHKSAGKKQEGKSCPYNNERLEYLGDAVIETAVSDILYHKYPEANEGFMSHIRSNMVCRTRLNAISFALGLDKYVVMSSRKDMEHSHISGDVLEAFVAAIYLDGGMKKAFKFVERVIANKERIDEALNDSCQTNFKSMLINLGEQNAIEVIFDTRRTENARSTEEEAMNFVCEIHLAAIVAGQGFGRSKKQAEQRAAEAVYDSIKNGEIDLLQLNKKEPATDEQVDGHTTPRVTSPHFLVHQPSKAEIKEILDRATDKVANFAEKAALWNDADENELKKYASHFKEYVESIKMAAHTHEQPDESLSGKPAED